MGRKKKRKDNVKADLKYNDRLVGRLISCVMQEGKRSTAARVVYDAFDIIAKRTKEEPLMVFLKAMDSGRPLLEVKPRRVGGATYQVPIAVPEYRSLALVVRWMLEIAKGMKGKPMAERLSQVIIETYKGEGALVKKKSDVHKMAEANKAFAHYVW